MKIVSIIPLGKITDKLSKIAHELNLTFIAHEDVLQEDILEAEIILGWDEKWKKSILSSQNLKWIQVWIAGVEQLPLQELNERGILITNSSGTHAINIAEQIIGYLIMFERSLHLTMRHQTKRTWDENLHFGELFDKTIGIIGVGQIGGRLAQLAKAFGMHTLGVRNRAREHQFIDKMYTNRDWDSVLPVCDYVVNILPDTKQTRYLFNEQLFTKFKKGSFYINVGRGKTTNTDALIQALKLGHIKGAALDVFEEEPLPLTHPLWEMENVIITPHIAGDTDRYAERMLDLVTYNLRSYLEDVSLLKNIVNARKQY